MSTKGPVHTNVHHLIVIDNKREGGGLELE